MEYTLNERENALMYKEEDLIDNESKEFNLAFPIIACPLTYSPIQILELYLRDNFTGNDSSCNLKEQEEDPSFVQSVTFPPIP